MYIIFFVFVGKTICTVHLHFSVQASFLFSNSAGTVSYETSTQSTREVFQTASFVSNFIGLPLISDLCLVWMRETFELVFLVSSS